MSPRATLSGRAGTKLRQEDKLRREDNNLTSQEARSVVFSPVSPHFRRRVRSSQGVAVAAHVRRRDGNLYFDGDDKALAAQSFRSPKANIIVFRALPEKPSELLHFSL